MQRRDLIKLAAWTAGAGGVRLCRAEGLAAAAGVEVSGAGLEVPAPEAVERVLVVSKCHLDVGFTATQKQVLQRYFDVYLPQAAATAAALRAEGPDRYTWTTGSYLLYEYLEQAGAAQRRAMETAIEAGDVAWHALPFSWQTEMVDRSMIAGALGFSAVLDRRFGRRTTGAKMSDVPGHSRGILGPLAAAGVRLLDIGVNAASTSPEVPEVFLWRDLQGASVVTVYHHHDYGGVVTIPGTKTVFAMEMATDNAGPHTREQIAATYGRLRRQFPRAVVEASNLNEVARVTDAEREHLPVVTQEIGDTWIYGVGSDPPKVARYRALARLRREWIGAGTMAAGDRLDLGMLRRLLLAAEHTWGTDTKRYLDHEHYTPGDLRAAIAEPARFPGYQVMTGSWQEKRDDISAALEGLPSALQEQAEGRLKSVEAAIGWGAAASWSRSGASSTTGVGMSRRPYPHGGAAKVVVEGKHFVVGVDAKTGAITRLQHRKSGREWANAERPLALFTYQTLSAEDYRIFMEAYVKTKEDWAPQDFGKPNIAAFGAESREWGTLLMETQHEVIAGGQRMRLTMQVECEDRQSRREVGRAMCEAATGLAPPHGVTLEIVLPDREDEVQLRLVTWAKPENRMPESMWLTFDPLRVERGADGWLLDKVGQQVRARDVVAGGGRCMHAVSDGIRCVDGEDRLEVLTLDAPLIALGRRSPLGFSMQVPDAAQGVHVNLFNNAWGTNYPQWCGGSWAYRFVLRAS